MISSIWQPLGEESSSSALGKPPLTFWTRGQLTSRIVQDCRWSTCERCFCLTFPVGCQCAGCSGWTSTGALAPCSTAQNGDKTVEPFINISTQTPCQNTTQLCSKRPKTSCERSNQIRVLIKFSTICNCKLHTLQNDPNI